MFSILLLLLVVAPRAHADEASKAKKVEDFFLVARLEQMFSQSLDLSMNQVKSSVMQETIGMKLPPEQAGLVDELQGKVATVLRSALGWEHLRPQYIKLYAEAFTEEQLDALLAFYKSPAGQAMVSNSPMLMQKGAQIAQQRMATVQPELRKILEEFTRKAREQ